MKQSHSRSTSVFRIRPLFVIPLLLAWAVMQSQSFSFQSQGLLRPPSSDTKNNADSSDIDRRQLLQQIVLFSVTSFITLPEAAASAPLIPKTTKATATFAKDKFGSALIAEQYVASKPARDRSLVFGLKDEPTYLIINEDKSSLLTFALNAECSHLGCIVPWNEFEKKFECPCHGSTYDAMGNVLRGPAPKSLTLAHVDTDEESGKIVMSPWTETDFRTNESPWWT